MVWRVFFITHHGPVCMLYMVSHLPSISINIPQMIPNVTINTMQYIPNIPQIIPSPIMKYIPNIHGSFFIIGGWDEFGENLGRARLGECAAEAPRCSSRLRRPPGPAGRRLQYRGQGYQGGLQKWHLQNGGLILENPNLWMRF